MTWNREDQGEAVRYRRSDRVATRTIAGENILVPITGTSADLTRLYLLNETAGAAWELLAKPHTVDSLCTALGREYGETSEVLRPDVEELLADLLERRLVAVEVHNG